MPLPPRVEQRLRDATDLMSRWNHPWGFQEFTFDGSESDFQITGRFSSDKGWFMTTLDYHYNPSALFSALEVGMANNIQGEFTRRYTQWYAETPYPQPESHLDRNIGWLSPEGDYYPCRLEDAIEYAKGGHQSLAEDLVNYFFRDQITDEMDTFHTGHQDLLVELGYVRLDFKNEMHKLPLTKAQCKTLWELSALSGVRFGKAAVRGLLEDYNDLVMELLREGSIK